MYDRLTRIMRQNPILTLLVVVIVIAGILFSHLEFHLCLCALSLESTNLLLHLVLGLIALGLEHKNTILHLGSALQLGDLLLQFLHLVSVFAAGPGFSQSLLEVAVESSILLFDLMSHSLDGDSLFFVFVL